LLLSFDREIYGAIFLSLKVSTIAAIIATVVGMPIGFLIGTNEFPGKRAVIVFFNALFSMPTVVIGLFVYGLLSRRGLLGFLGILYTPNAMIMGQAVLILPLIIALSISAAQAIEKRVFKTALTLGANYPRAAFSAFLEARYAFLAAIIASFGRAFGEIGVSMMLGGNIRGYTRNITTAIASETEKGEFAFAIALGLVLLLVAGAISIAFQFIQLSMRKSANGKAYS